MAVEALALLDQVERAQNVTLRNPADQATPMHLPRAWVYASVKFADCCPGLHDGDNVTDRIVGGGSRYRSAVDQHRTVLMRSW
jgi:hypothetical protein